MATLLEKMQSIQTKTSDSRPLIILQVQWLGLLPHTFLFPFTLIRNLIALKLNGVDGGGFPGRGLWEVYPVIISVPFAAGVSILVHAIACYAMYSL